MWSTQRIIVGDVPFWYITSSDHLWESLRPGTPSYRLQPWCVSITLLSRLVGLEWATFPGFLSGLGPLLGFVFLSLKLSSLFVMVYANIKKTIAIDLSPLSPDLSRQDLVRILVNKFENVTIKAIQFVPVKLVHVTFVDSATREIYAHVENIILNGISCRVLGVGPQARTVFVYHYPFEEDDNCLKLALGPFGKVLEVCHQHHVGFNSVCTGTRLVKMVREHPIRRNLDVGGYCVKVWYVGQPLECDICSRGHISRDCPVRDKCRKCLEPGHVARNCPNPPRAWEAVNHGPNTGGVSSVSSDPTPAEAAQASGGDGSSGEWPLSSSVQSGVGAHLVSGGLDWGEQMDRERMDLRDNELSPLSDSDSGSGFHASPSLSDHANKDSNVNNDTEVNVSNDQCSNGSSSDEMSQSILRDQNGIISNQSCSNDSSATKGSKSSLNNQSSSTSNVNSGISVVNGRSAGGTGASGAAGVSMAEASLLGKRAISEVETSTDGDSASGGALSAPKKSSGKATRAKKVAPSETTRKTSVASSQGRRSRQP